MSRKLLFIVLISVLCIQTKAQVAVTIDFSAVKQVIDGFGASTAWHGAISSAEADASFGNDNTNQMGLSILRVCISPGGTSTNTSWNAEKSNAQMAKARGAKVLATPWSPPATMKTNSNTIGGELLPASYAAYAAHLKSFCTYLGNVDVVSIQNEPNITVSYESCTWSPTQILNFCINNASSIGTPVMAPEAYNFDSKFADPILSNPTSTANIDYIGGHLYGTSTRSYPLATTLGKKLWMTEYYLNPDSMGTCMTMAKDILDCLYGNMNAYVWWYLRTPGCNLINTGGALKLKGYTMGQFSKFIRPGYVRVNGSYNSNPNIYTVAFKGTSQDVIVVLNLNRVVKKQVFNLRNANIESATKFVTSATKRITNDGTIACTSNSFTDDLEARSVTTYVLKRAPTAINETLTANISVYPNPAHDYLKLSTIENLKSVYITNLIGQKYVSINNPTSSTIDISTLLTGNYILTINQNGIEKHIKFIKQ
jgi:glucuronoarabinoxylan endo-1,4-beta-xylanase